MPIPPAFILRKSLCPDFLWLKGPESQRFVGRRFVELRSRKYLSRYDLRVLFNGFAYCLIVGACTAEAARLDRSSRSRLYRDLGQVNVEKLCSARTAVCQNAIRGFDPIHPLIYLVVHDLRRIIYRKIGLVRIDTLSYLVAYYVCFF
jgi:hypothetical protein